MNEITPLELKRRIDRGEEIQIIDIREEHELSICTINGTHIPMDQVLESIDKIRKDIKVVVHCRSGERASAVVVSLEMKFGLENVYNLKGGIMGYAEEVEPSMERY